MVDLTIKVYKIRNDLRSVRESNRNKLHRNMWKTRHNLLWSSLNCIFAMWFFFFLSLLSPSLCTWLSGVFLIFKMQNVCCFKANAHRNPITNKFWRTRIRDSKCVSVCEQERGESGIARMRYAAKRSIPSLSAIC